MNTTLVLLAILCLGVVTGSDVLAQNALLSGKRFERKLNGVARLYFSVVPTRDVVTTLTQTQHIAVWLDRRVDPDLPLTYQKQSRLQDCLWELGEADNDLDVAWFDDVVYFAPTGKADQVATLHEIHIKMLSRLQRSQRSVWLRKQPLKIARLSSPVNLIADLEKELGHAIAGREKVVHDLWDERSTPPLPLFQRLELILAGFGLTYTFLDDGGAKVVAMPDSPRVNKTVAIPRAKQEQIKELIEGLENAALTGKQLSGSWRVHEAVRRQRRSGGKKPDRASIRYTLTAENQELGMFVAGLCHQLDLECEWLGVEGEVLTKRISFDVEEVTLQQLFTTILDQAELKFALRSNSITITPGEQSSCEETCR